MRARKKIRQRKVTLIELLLVIGLIGMISSAVQWGFLPLLRSSSFSHEVSQVREAIALTQEVMMATEMDLTLHLDHQEKELLITLTSPQPLSHKVQGPIEKIRCHGVTKLSFNDEPTTTLLLHFHGHLSVTSKGKITITSDLGKEEIILLHGFPGRLS